MGFANNYNKILIVDDDADSRHFLSVFLTGKGYDVSTAEDGCDAIELIKTCFFSIVITDMVMPKMDGIELLKKIKITSPLTEVIMISGFDNIDLAVESFRNQALDYIKKPVDIKTLENAVGRAREKISIKKGLQDYTENLERLVTSKTNQLENVQQVTMANNELKSLLNSLPIVIFIIDQNFKITALNNMYKQKFGDHTGSCCYEVTRKNKLPCNECPAVKALENNRFEQAEINFTDEEGNNISSLVCASPVTGVSKQATEIMIISADVNKVRDINDNLTSLGLMVGSVSHGIKGLLTGLDGGVYVLDSALKKKNQNKAEEGLDMVRKVTSRMKSMVLDILYYSRERELSKKSISASQFAGDLLKIIRPKASEKNILIQYHPLREDFELEIDSGTLTSGLINIFDNAIDACLEDDLKELHEITFKLLKKEDTAEFIIADNGAGIEEDDIRNIFTLFHSGKGRQGTGLGLFITEKAVKQHGGSIRVESKKGVGSTFFISIPIS